jgi:phosphatidylinositol kinase/protein kinase (PI-3  family)
MNSKQTPEKLRIQESDGHSYQFLAKAAEDLEMDNRAMRFFSLMNEYLRMGIRTYTVTPLTTGVGLIQ